ncbi:restriction endonuclease subunit S [uncultured Helicobacter sp.]|uniref:restriction endonuclease subunit S n=1 Tax=uncultured Helicobacter sp. TaxID=175537 RepID=UPI00261E182D|nr:restriction endonuclease subunit S [uncultured Helicobacter sp.]
MNLHSKHLKTLQTLFAKHPTIAQALLFGSRALGTHKESSDIDIALKGDITPTLLAHLKEELEDSTLPYFCDILDYERAPQELKEHIDTHALTLYKREEEWQEVRLGDVVEIKYGKDHKHLESGDIPTYGSGGIMRYVDSAIYDKESVLIPRKGTLNNIFYTKNPFWVVDTMFYTVIDTQKILPKFLYYTLKTFDFNLYNVGSAVPSLTTKILNDIQIPLPPLERQKEIAEILSSFDDKIDFLHRQNHTLESLAQTLFRHYFIDNAKEEWEEKLLSDFGTIVCGKTPSKNNKSYYGGNYPFIKIPDMHGNIFVFSTADTLTQEGADSQKNKILPPLSICVSCIATEAQTNQQINSIIPHKPHYRYYLFLYLQSLYDELHALASGGTATLNLNTGDFSKIKIPMPSDEELLGFHNKIELIFDKIFRNMFSQQKTLFLSKKLLRELIAKI